MARLIALIRGINVGSTRKLPMAELRVACAESGLGSVRTYIQSGNLVMEGTDAAATETALETLIAERFGLDVPVIVRTEAEWQALAAACPFPDEAEADPNKTMLLVTKAPLADGAVEALIERVRDDERIARCGAGLAIHYPSGAGSSRLSPSLIDRLCGSPATARNWNTVLKLIEMAEARS